MEYGTLRDYQGSTGLTRGSINLGKANGKASPTDFANSTSERRFDCGNIDFSHRHHRVERTLGCGGIGTGDCLGQHDRRDLPGQSPLVLAPSALALLAAVADDSIPVAIRFRLVNGCYLKRKCFALLERRPAIEPKAGNAHHGELDGQHVPLLP